MAIKIIENGKVEKLTLHSSDITVLDVANKFKDKNLESVITEISDTEHLHIGEVDLEKEGVWIEDNEILDSKENNGVVDRLKNYFNGIVGDLKTLTTNSKDTLVNAINENTSSINQLSNPNLLINGDFQVWQRGTEFTNINGYTADRWKDFYWNCSTNISKVQMDTPEGKKNCIKINLSQCNNASFILRQYLDDIPLGTPLTLSYWVKGVKGSEVATTFYDANRKSEILTGEWQKITNSYTFPNDSSFKPTPFICFLRNDGNGKLLDGDYYVTNIKLEIGEKATPFVSRLYGEELALCQRYYQYIDYSENTGAKMASQYSAQLERANFDIDLPTPMRILPTVIIEKTNPLGMRFVNNKNIIQSTDNSIERVSVNNRHDFKNIFLYMKLSTPTTSSVSGWVDSFVVKLDAEIY